MVCFFAQNLLNVEKTSRSIKRLNVRGVNIACEHRERYDKHSLNVSVERDGLFIRKHVLIQAELLDFFPSSLQFIIRGLPFKRK